MSNKQQNNKENNAMKKRVITATAMVAMLFGLMSMPEAKAQVFFDEDAIEDNQRSGSDNPADLPNIPQLGSTLDQYEETTYVPLGGEILALGLLGSAYLIGKRRKEQ